MLAAPGVEIEPIAVNAAPDLAVLENTILVEPDVLVRADPGERKQVITDPRDHHRPGHALDRKRTHRPTGEVTEVADADAQGHVPSIRVDRAWSPRQAAPAMLSTLSKVLCLVVALVGCDKGSSDKGRAGAPPSQAAATGPGATAPAVAAAAAEGKTFGAGVSLAETTAVDAVLADPNAYKGKTIRVEGMVTDVCPKRGCWFEMAAGEPGKKLKFKVTDGEMVFPMDAKGQWAVAQGTVSVRELTLEQSKQYAEYQAKEYGKPYDPASITTPTSVVQIDGTGAVFRDKR